MCSIIRVTAGNDSGPWGWGDIYRLVGMFFFGPDLGPAHVQLIVPFGWGSVWPIALSFGIARHAQVADGWRPG